MWTCRLRSIIDLLYFLAPYLHSPWKVLERLTSEHLSEGPLPNDIKQDDMVHADLPDKELAQ